LAWIPYASSVAKLTVKELFGRRVRALRLRRRLTQEGLAERADLHATYVGYIERGECNVTIKTAVAIARALGVRSAALLEGID